MHIFIHSQYYPPEIGAPQNRLHELALELLSHKFQVTVLTAMPNYPQGRIYDGYKGLFKKEIFDNVHVIRSAIYPTQSVKLLPRLFSYFSFMFSSLITGIWLIRRADLILTESPPIILGITGWLLSRCKRIKWIFNISDLWPESIVELGVFDRQSWGHKFISSLEEALYKKAWLVTGQSKTIIQNIKARFPDIRTYHLSNGVDTKLFRPNSNQYKNKNFQVFYAGLHGLAQGLEQIIQAACQIPFNDKITFTFLGDGPEKKRLMQMTEEVGLENFYFQDPVQKEEVPHILQHADAILIPLKIQLTGAIPSKLYEAMAMAKPIILIAGSEAAQIVQESQCGIVVSPGDLDGLVSAIKYLKNHPEECVKMGKNGRMEAIKNYDRKHIADRFAQFLLQEKATS